MDVKFFFLYFVGFHLLSVLFPLSLEVSLQHFLHRGHRPDPGRCWCFSDPVLPTVSCMESEERCSGAACLGYCRPVDPRSPGVGRGHSGTGGRVHDQPGTRSWSRGEGRGWPG